MPRRKLGLLFALIAGAAPLLAAPTTLRFEMAVKKDSELGLEIRNALQKAFAKAGFETSFEDFPSRRGMEELRAGRIDGAAARVGALNLLFDIPDIVRLDVPMTTVTLSLWCSKSMDEIKTLKQARVAFFHGSIFANRLIQTVTDKSVEFIDITSYRSMLSMLSKGRLDCFIGSETTMESDGITAKDWEALSSHKLVTSAAYPWINKRYAAAKTLVEKELLAHEFPGPWTKKYRSDKPACKDRFDWICPDGRIFTREQSFESAP